MEPTPQQTEEAVGLLVIAVLAVAVIVAIAGFIYIVVQ